MNIFQYSGTEPTISTGLQKEILDIMKAQLEVLKQMSSVTILIKEGTKLKDISHQSNAAPKDP